MSSLRFGLGPVFAYEWLRASRRWQLYAGRSAFLGLVLLGLCFTWGSWSNRNQDFGSMELAALGQIIYATIVNIELTMILFAAPAATAGSVCLDKARGSLVQVMATDLTDSEIVLGKLAAGLVPVAGLVFSVLPVLMLASLLGGIDPLLLLASFLVTLATAILVCTLAFTLSVWGKKTHEVLGATYLILLAWLVLVPFLGFALLQWLGVGGWPEMLMDLVQAGNPYALMYPDFNQPAAEHLWPVSIYAATCLGLSAMMVVACILTIRPVTLKQRAEGGRPRGGGLQIRLPRLLPAPSLDGNPVLWREWTRSRPTRWGRFVGGCYGLFAIVLTVMAVFEGPGMLVGVWAGFANVYIVGVGLLLMSVRASTSLSEERVRGSLDVLVSTPLTTPQILAGKWWGALRTAWPMLLLPAVIAIVPCLEKGRWPHLAAYLALIASYAALTTSMGLAAAVWVARQGRAVGLCVALYVAACIGWPIFTAFAAGPGIQHAAIFLLGSPLLGAGMGSSSLMHPADDSDWPAQMIIYSTIWAVLQVVMAILVFRIACESFDEKLGRTSDLSERNLPWRYTRALLPFLPDEPPRGSPGPDGPTFSES